MIRADVELNRILPLPESGDQLWIPLVPADQIVSGRDGREFKNPGADYLIANQIKRGVDVVIDLEHATEIKGPKGDSAPAYGWITELKNDNGVLMGKVEWTPKGEETNKNREYRYYSPAYRLSLPDRRIEFVKSIGLTNSPNLELPALNSEKKETGGEELIIPASILVALGLNSEATEVDVVTAINKIKDSTSLNSETIKNMVPKADLDLALNRANTAETALNSLKDTAFKEKVTAVIDKAVQDGKIAPSSKEFYVTTCNSEETLRVFEEHIAKNGPVIEKNSEEPSGNPPAGGSLELNSEELEVSRLMGLTTEEAKAYFGKEKK